MVSKRDDRGIVRHHSREQKVIATLPCLFLEGSVLGWKRGKRASGPFEALFQEKNHAWVASCLSSQVLCCAVLRVESFTVIRLFHERESQEKQSES